MPIPLPSGACDCHVHIVGPPERFPQRADRSYTAECAELASLRSVAEPAGITRLVVTQPSFYGPDNSCLLAALDALGGQGCGVVTIDAQKTDAELLRAYSRRGVRGVRLNLYSPMSVGRSRDLKTDLAFLTERLPEPGWHIEIVSPADTLASAAPVIAQAKVPIVIDHYGLPGDATPESRVGCGLLELARRPHVWVKLSAPYRTGPDPLATAPPTGWLRAFLDAAPGRCVWGSDWPHTAAHAEYRGPHVSAPYRKIEYGRLLGDFLAALPDSETVRRVLVENPARLYGFAPCEDE